MMRNIDLIHLNEIDSTNLYALDVLSKSGPIHGMTIFTDFQSAGKGQIGRFWSSVPRQNVLMSCILILDFVPPKHQFAISQMVAVTLRRWIAHQGIPDVSIKWPNDIYIGDRKVAGILIQNQLQGQSIKSTVVGIGANVYQDEWPPSIPNPTSISMHTTFNSKIMDCVAQIREDLLLSVNLLKSDLQAFENEYHRHLYLRDLEHTFFRKGQRIIGTIKGVDRDGYLLLEIQGNLTKINIHDISYVGV